MNRKMLPAFLWGVMEFMVIMIWFKTDGFGVDIPRLRQVDPQLMDFGT